MMCVAVAFLGLRLIAGQVETTNLVSNGDFSAIINGVPVAWEAAGNTSTVTQKLSVIRDSGRGCALLSCTHIEGEGGDTHAMIAQLGKVSLEAGKTYEFTCRAREEKLVGGSVSVAISDTSSWENCGLDTGLALGPNWRTFRRIFKATKSVGKSSRLQIWFTETGDLYLSDVRIVATAVPKADFTDVVPSSQGKNRLPNGSFEVGTASWSSYGIPVGWGGMLGHLCGSIRRSDDPQHSQFLRIELGGGKTPVLGFDYPHASIVKQTQLLAANRRWIQVIPNQPYTLSCDVRASKASVKAVLGYATMDPETSSSGMREEQRVMTAGPVWSRVSFTFWPSRRYLFIMVGPESADDESTKFDVDHIQLESGREPTSYQAYSASEVSVEPSAPSGIYVAGEQPSLTFRYSTADAASGLVHLDVSASDFYGKLVRQVSLALKPGMHTVDLPKDWRGWFQIQVTAKESKVAITTPSVRIAVVPKLAAGETVLGLNHAFPDPYLIDLAKKMGISQYREWALRWDGVEPSKGDYHWSGADDEISRVLSQGVGTIALLPPFPSSEWSSSAPKDLPQRGDLGEGSRQSWAPTDTKDLAEFATQSANHYRGKIHVWEFLNEPIFTSYALPGPKYGTDDYMSLLRPTAAAIRKADPGCLIIGGAAAGPGRLTTEMFNSGLLDSIDILNLHIYPGLTAPERFLADMAKLNQEMEARGKRKPVWITEFSYYGADNPPRIPFIPWANDWAEDRLLGDEKQCADYTIRFLAVMLAQGVQRVFIHSGTNSAVNLTSTECCLFDYGGVPRKVAPALAVFCSLLGPNPKPVSRLTSPNGFYGMVFDTGRQAAAVVWSTGGPATVTIPTGSRAVDMMGNPVSAKTAKVAQSPIYILARSGSAATLARGLMTTETAR